MESASVPSKLKRRPSLIPTVVVAGGSFQQGQRTLDPADSGRTITVSSFLMGETVVTQAQYRAVVGTNPSRFSGDLNPVERVSWFDAVAFCNQLSTAEGLIPAYTISGTTVTWDPQGHGLETAHRSRVRMGGPRRRPFQGLRLPGVQRRRGRGRGAMTIHTEELTPQRSYRPTNSAFMGWRETFGSGVGTGTSSIGRLSPPLIPKVRRWVLIASIAAEDGTTTTSMRFGRTTGPMMDRKAKKQTSASGWFEMLRRLPDPASIAGDRQHHRL